MLKWPDETIEAATDLPGWEHCGSNICLDFHGDPLMAKLVVFSDGNHHMALMETLRLFYQKYPDVKHIFYATTPPAPIVKLLKSGRLKIGNLILSIKPHIFISPPNVLDSLVTSGYIKEHVPFMKNRGSVLLVRHGNPKKISGIKDLARNDVRIFISNPQTETVSYRGYGETLVKIGEQNGVDLSFVKVNSAQKRLVFGKNIHHREAPQAVHDGRADVAIVYYHLALRYTRIFKSLFQIIPLGGTIEQPEPFAENVISYTHLALVGDGGHWGPEFFDFLLSDNVSRIYHYHGLLRS